MLFKTSFVHFESSIGMVVALITGRHSKTAELAQAQLPLRSLFHGVDTITTYVRAPSLLEDQVCKYDI